MNRADFITRGNRKKYRKFKRLTVMTVHVMRVRQRFARQVVLLADKLVVVQDIEFLAGAHLFPTH